MPAPVCFDAVYGRKVQKVKFDVEDPPKRAKDGLFHVHFKTSKGKEVSFKATKSSLCEEERPPDPRRSANAGLLPRAPVAYNRAEKAPAPASKDWQRPQWLKSARAAQQEKIYSASEKKATITESTSLSRVDTPHEMEFEDFDGSGIEKLKKKRKGGKKKAKQWVDQMELPF